MDWIETCKLWANFITESVDSAKKEMPCVITFLREDNETFISFSQSILLYRRGHSCTVPFVETEITEK